MNLKKGWTAEVMRQRQGLPWRSSVEIALQGVQVQSLVWELRACIPHGHRGKIEVKTDETRV